MSSCQICRGLSKPAGKQRLFLEFIPAELVRSALQENCRICTGLLRGIQVIQDESWDLNVDVSKLYGYALAEENDTLIFEIYFSDGRTRRKIEFFRNSATEDLSLALESGDLGNSVWLKALTPRTRTTGHPLFPDAVQWVKSLMTRCSTRHSCQAMDEPPLPTRVLAICSSEGGSYKIQLVDGKNRSGRYATLSHCWGGKLACTTTTTNYQERAAGIPWTEIPKTFQDAIRYCIELEIPHIWIDALCILQDDMADWQTESTKMADVYQYSYLTLAATSASHSTVGCFPAEMQPNSDKVVNIENEDGGLFSVLVREKVPHWTDNMSAIQEHYPLLARGWVFQERVLSPRVLHFAKEELVWECGNEKICECGHFTSERHLKGEFATIRDLIWDEVSANRGRSQLYAFGDLKQAGQRADKKEAGVQFGLCVKDLRCKHFDQILESETFAMSVVSLLEEAYARISNLAKATKLLHDAQDRERKDDEARRLGFLNDFNYIGTTVACASKQFGRAQREYSDLGRLARRIPVTKLDEVMEVWHDLVSQFSSLQLTKDTDRLPALSGLAARIQPFMGEYLAGLWASSLAYDVAWRVESISSGMQRPKQYRGPSWSWVSVNVRVCYWSRSEMSPVSLFRKLGEELPDQFYMWARGSGAPQKKRGGKSELFKRTPLFSPKTCSIRKSGRNPYGAVSSAYLAVDGFLLLGSISVSPQIEPTNQSVLEAYRINIKFYSDENGVPPIVPSLKIPFFADYDLRCDPSLPKVRRPFGLDMGPSEVVKYEIFLLMVFEDICLVLVREPFSMHGQNVYRRIGIFRLTQEYTEMYRLNMGNGAVREQFILI